MLAAKQGRAEQLKVSATPNLSSLQERSLPGDPRAYRWQREDLTDSPGFVSPAMEEMGVWGEGRRREEEGGGGGGRGGIVSLDTSFGGVPRPTARSRAPGWLLPWNRPGEATPSSAPMGRKRRVWPPRLRWKPDALPVMSVWEQDRSA